MEAFISIDYVIENIKRAHRPVMPREPEAFGMDAAIAIRRALHNTRRAELGGGQFLLKPTSLYASMGRSIFAPSENAPGRIIRPCGDPVAQGTSCRPTHGKVFWSGPKAFERGPDHHPCRVHHGRGGDSRTHSGGRRSADEATILQTMQPHLFCQLMVIAEAIETACRMMTWLPGDPWIARSR